ncbi:MAG TPA: arylsulfotransferase family protein, partial [Solirubrobacteraceae bacterium]|nr:arylsulfotransferase family protein [Solirubrobacteraceae bacterium]
AALITTYDPIYCNLSSVGGAAHGAVTDGLLQEIDVRTGLVMFQWSSLDHVALAESYELAVSSHTDWPFDFFHINSIGLTHDGSLLVSARNTWTVYDVDSATGQIQWQLGGKHPSFTMGPGTNAAWQHDPRELPDGTFSVFDNGAAPKVHSQSRGIVLSIDPQLKITTLVGQFTRPAPLLAYSQGNMQALPGGDWFMGWGQVPAFSELSPTGRLLFDAHFPAGDQSYRDFRFVWTGVPAHPPTFVVARGSGGASAVYASWNGATEVASWRVLAGTSATRMRTVAKRLRTGFETAIPVPAGAPGPYVTVQALDAEGRVLGVAPTAVRLG